MSLQGTYLPTLRRRLVPFWLVGCVVRPQLGWPASPAPLDVLACLVEQLRPSEENAEQTDPGCCWSRKRARESRECNGRAAGLKLKTGAGTARDPVRCRFGVSSPALWMPDCQSRLLGINDELTVTRPTTYTTGGWGCTVKRVHSGRCKRLTYRQSPLKKKRSQKDAGK